MKPRAARGAESAFILAIALALGWTALVGLAASTGERWFDAVREGETQDARARADAALGLALHASNEPSADLRRERLIRSGGGAAGAIVEAARAESGGRPIEARLWHSLDSRARGFFDLAMRAETAAAPGAQGPDAEAIERVFPGFDLWRRWAADPWPTFERGSRRLEELGPLPSP
jgi:hypothetical protein